MVRVNEAVARIVPRTRGACMDQPDVVAAFVAVAALPFAAVALKRLMLYAVAVLGVRRGASRPDPS